MSDPDNSTSISGAFYGPSLAIAYQDSFGMASLSAPTITTIADGIKLVTYAYPSP